jgi:hypothetical protein
VAAQRVDGANQKAISLGGPARIVGVAVGRRADLVLIGALIPLAQRARRWAAS